MSNTNNPIGQNILRLRSAHHWSQEQLALISGVNSRTIQRAESGDPVSLETLKALAAAFKTDVESLKAPLVDAQAALEELEKKYAFIDLAVLERAAAISAAVAGSSAFLLERCGELSDEQADAVAEFEQEMKEYMDLWPDLQPVQRREAEKQLQLVIDGLRSLDLTVSIGSEALKLRPHSGGPAMHVKTVYVAVVPGKTALRVFLREKRAPVSFA